MSPFQKLNLSPPQDTSKAPSTSARLDVSTKATEAADSCHYPAPAPPPASLANPYAGLRSSRGFHHFCRLETPYVMRRACPRGPLICLCPTSSRVQGLLLAQQPCKSSSCRKAVRCRGISRRWRPKALETLRLPPGSGAKASAMFGAGDEDDTDFLSPSGG